MTNGESPRKAARCDSRGDRRIERREIKIQSNCPFIIYKEKKEKILETGGETAKSEDAPFVRGLPPRTNTAMAFQASSAMTLV